MIRIVDPAASGSTLADIDVGPAAPEPAPGYSEAETGPTDAQPTSTDSSRRARGLPRPDHAGAAADGDSIAHTEPPDIQPPAFGIPLAPEPPIPGELHLAR